MRRFQLTAVAVLFGLLVGCLPIELDVNEHGQLVISREEGWFLFDPGTSKVTKLREAGNGKPVFARFSPDGKDLLTVIEAADGFQDFEFHVGPIAGGPARKLVTTKNPTYITYSPDGSQLGLIRVAEESKAPFDDQQLPELLVVDAKTGSEKVLLSNIGTLCRWMPDSKSIMVLQILKKTEEEHFSGNLVTVDIDSGKVTPIVAVLASQDFHFDLSKDGKQAALCAFAASAAGKSLTTEEFPDKKLFAVDVAAKTVRNTGRKAEVALFSPSGKQLILTGSGDDFADFGSTNLYLTDASMKSFKKIAGKLYSNMSFGGGGTTYPGWINETQIYYFGEKAVYGTEGKAIQLMVLGTNGTKAKSVQPLIDIVANGDTN